MDPGEAYACTLKNIHSDGTAPAAGRRLEELDYTWKRTRLTDTSSSALTASGDGEAMDSCGGSSSGSELTGEDDDATSPAPLAPGLLLPAAEEAAAAASPLISIGGLSSSSLSLSFPRGEAGTTG